MQRLSLDEENKNGIAAAAPQSHHTLVVMIE
jgi:hypothetical protein